MSPIVNRKKPNNRLAVLMAIVLFVAAFPFCCFWLLDATFGRTPQEEATLTAVASLTDLHGEEARSALERYYSIFGSIEVYQQPDILAQVMTGVLLEKQLEWRAEYTPSEAYILRTYTVDEVRVLEYNDSQMRFVACGTHDWDEYDYDRDFLDVSVFVKENGVWKLFAGYDFMDADGARRDWAYVSDWEREAIGDLPSYVDLYFGCGLGR